MNDLQVSTAPLPAFSKKPAGWLQWLLPSTAEICFLTLVLILLFGRTDPYFLYDGDRGWHIRAGQYILDTHRIPHQDIFSFSMPHAWWVAYEWGTEVIFAALDRHFGLNGIIVLVVFILAASYALLYRLLRREGFSFTLSFLTLLCVILGSRFHWAARPQVVSYLFVVLFIFILDRFSQGSTPARRLWFLPILMIFWVNLHPGFIAGEILLFTFLISAALRYTFSRAEQRASQRARLRQISVIAAATWLASLVNPYGFGIYIYLVRFFSTVHTLLPVSELLSPIFQMSVFQPYLASILLLIFLVRYTRYRLRLEETFTLSVWIALGLISLRNIPVTMFICAPIYARLLRGLNSPFQEWISRAPRLQARIQTFCRRLERAISMEQFFNRHVLLVGVLLVLVWSVAHQGHWGDREILHFRYTDESDYPAAGMNYLRTHRPSGHVFNEWAMGGYLLYDFYPDIRVFADGRLDFYGADFARLYLNVINTPQIENRTGNWREVFNRYQIQWVFIRPNLPLRLVLDADQEWERLLLDEHCAIFRRKEMLK
ncbi:MAG: hypothetical protein LAO21_14210 [Acidobacteriia bacterium]|nr:hypothetical protein [Terriglobia bacterium]